MAVSCAGPEKLIFGSDYPLLPPGRYREGLDRLAPGARAAVSARQRAKGVLAVSEGVDHSHDLQRLLEELVAGDAGLEDVLQRLRLLQVAQLGEFARLDMNRDLRKGRAGGHLRAPQERRRTGGHRAPLSRPSAGWRWSAAWSRREPRRCRLALTSEPRLACDGLSFDYNETAGVLSARMPTYRPPEERGCVGLLTAGTSDIPVAEEAALVAVHMGCRVERGYDAGVAGIHRLLEPLTRMLESGADVLVVAAGMEGALPSVVAGLVDIPVIGVPTSTGYGMGGDGTAALYSILQSCSPGLVAVNIDNGVGAGAAAALIARRRPG